MKCFRIERRIFLLAIGAAFLPLTGSSCDGHTTVSNPTPYVTSTRLNIALIGDANDPRLRDARDELTRMGHTVTVSATLPAPAVPYPDVVALHPSASLTPTDADTLRAYLGKAGVVSLSTAPNKLVTGPTPKSLSPISDFFGGAQGQIGSLEFGGGSYVTTARPNKLFDAPDAGVKHTIIGDSNDDAYFGALSTRADVVIAGTPDPLGAKSNAAYAFAYVPDAGGRVYWQATFGVTTPAGGIYSLSDRYFYESVFDRGMRWTAGK